MRLVVAALAAAFAVLAGATVGCAPADESDPSEPGEGESVAALSEAYTAWSALADSRGLRATPGRARVIGLRGQDTAGRLHDTRVARVFDDALVVLTADGRAVTLAASTHPWETSSPHSPDVDGDGAGDVGMLAPGRYLAVARPASRDIAGLPTWHVLTTGAVDGLPGARNTDHDAVYSDAERAASSRRGDKLTAILFHKGGEGAPAAIGCQVLDAAGVKKLAALVAGRDRFDYLLIDAATLGDGAVALPKLPPPG
ncbi:MAG: hypothetical protein JNL38_39905 [Myxococcales bacterium]|jgi:hypothetical protein|nr:hypothetical protein [Myxococcales bacterium]